jgi:sugar/nucleoside kinase (ribokinase family)
LSAERPERRTVGIGSMVADRLHRVPRILGIDQKGIMRPGADGGTAELRVGGVVLNHLGWAAVLGLPVGIFGKQADDASGRFLRDAMDRFGIAKDLVLDGSASSFADISVDDAARDHMAPGATSGRAISTCAVTTSARSQRAARDDRVSRLPPRPQARLCRLASRERAHARRPRRTQIRRGAGTYSAELEQLVRRAKILKPSALAALTRAGAGGDALAAKLRGRFGGR